MSETPRKTVRKAPARKGASSTPYTPRKLGKFAEFDLDEDGNECVILYENTGPSDTGDGRTRSGSAGMHCYHYLNEISDEDRATILRLQEENENPELPFFSGLDPVVGEKYLTFMNGRIAYGPFADWNAVAAQLESQGYQVSYTDKLLKSQGYES